MGNDEYDETAKQKMNVPHCNLCWLIFFSTGAPRTLHNSFDDLQWNPLGPTNHLFIYTWYVDQNMSKPWNLAENYSWNLKQQPKAAKPWKNVCMWFNCMLVWFSLAVCWSHPVLDLDCSWRHGVCLFKPPKIQHGWVVAEQGPVHDHLGVSTIFLGCLLSSTCGFNFSGTVQCWYMVPISYKT